MQKNFAEETDVKKTQGAPGTGAYRDSRCRRRRECPRTCRRTGRVCAVCRTRRHCRHKVAEKAQKLCRRPHRAPDYSRRDTCGAPLRPFHNMRRMPLATSPLLFSAAMQAAPGRGCHTAHCQSGGAGNQPYSGLVGDMGVPQQNGVYLLQ